MTSALEEVAAAADEMANEQREIARTARQLQRRLDRGQSWAAVLDREPFSGLVSRLRSSTQRLAQTTGRFVVAVAAGLQREGESHRSIARRLGVSHQRVTTMLNDRRNTTVE
jgi:hypothetical protein